MISVALSRDQEMDELFSLVMREDMKIVVFGLHKELRPDRLGLCPERKLHLVLDADFLCQFLFTYYAKCDCTLGPANPTEAHIIKSAFFGDCVLRPLRNTFETKSNASEKLLLPLAFGPQKYDKRSKGIFTLRRDLKFWISISVNIY